MRVGVLTIGLWLSCTLCARAEEGVVLRERDGMRPGLCAALRIQLSGAAEVHCERDAESEPLAARIVSTAARVRQRGARVGVLLERDPAPELVRMYLVGATDDQAVIAVERIEDRPEPDVDRSLALKVRAAYELIATVRAVAPHSAGALAGQLAMPPAGVGSRASSWLLFLEAGGGGSFGADVRAAANAFAGLSQVRARLRLEAGLGGGFAAPRKEKRGYGAVTAYERDAVLTLRALWRSGRLEIGGVAQGMLSFLSAQGIAQDGTYGERRLVTPALALGADLRMRLFSSAYLRAAPLCEVLMVERRLGVDGRVLLTEGRVRATLSLSLLVALPLWGAERRGER